MEIQNPSTLRRRMKYPYCSTQSCFSKQSNITCFFLHFQFQIKEFHSDVTRDRRNSVIIILSNYSKSDIIDREFLDPFDQPECEAFDVFVNEVLCVGKGCPYLTVNRAPHAFTFSSLSGTAQETSQGHGEDYQVQLAVGQCPRSCIHYVTPSQRIILEELLDSIMNKPYDTSAEADLLYSLPVKATYENKQYPKSKKNSSNYRF